MKNKIYTLVMVFCLGIIFTYTAFPTSHALDSYCTVCNGYNETSLWFLQNGRVLSYLFLQLMNVIHMPFNTLGYVSALLANLFFAFAITILFYKITENLKNTNLTKKIMLLAAIFLLYYNPLLTSILLLDEVCIIALGIMALTLSAIKLYEGGLKNYIISLLLCLVGIYCYQGISAYLFLSLFILLITNNKLNLKSQITKVLLTFVNYTISFITNYLIIKLIYSVTKKNIQKVGSFSIIKNINIIFNKLLPESLKNYYGYLNYIKIYHLLVIASFVILIIFIIMNSNKLKNTLYTICLLISCLFISFIPNLFMASNSNYTDARMTLTLLSVPICILIVVIAFNKNRWLNYGIGFILTIYLCISGYSVHQNMKIDIKRFKNDTTYLNEVNSRINNYQTKKHKKIKQVYYINDIDSAYYYDFGYANGANIRLMKVDWAFECAFKTLTNKTIKIDKMNKSDYKKYFNGQNYDKISSKQFVFKNDTLYLLIY